MLVALQLGDEPVIQLGFFSALCMINLIYLVHTQIYADRWMYQVEVFNDLSVYMTGIHGLAFTATLTNFGAYDTLGYSLGSLVVVNLVINMGFIIFDSCIQLKKKMAAKLARAQKLSHAWDANVRAHFTCNCKCVTCGCIETKTTVFTEKGKKMCVPPVD